MKKVQTYLPVFPGFYNTIFEPEEDRGIEYINELRQEKGLKEIDFDDFEFNYSEYQNDVSKQACEIIERELKEFVKSIAFEDLSSPKEYNFRNDSINCTIELTKENEKIILKYLKENESEFATYLKEKYTSCSGFISYYENTIDGFMTDTPLEHKHKLGSILDFICENEGITQETIYYNLEVYLEVSNYSELVPD